VAPAPLVTIITATYNWSSALRCAIESVRMQTCQDFEHLVIGDGCTDDSADVVASFGDPCLRWINLPANSGGQAVPNNHGIALARGTYIAYLGHDDVWHPTHLETLLAAVQSKRADMAGAVMILYGPPGTRVRAVSGVFSGGDFSMRDFMPPSSMLHTRALAEKIGPWRDGSVTRVPTDVEFQQRALAAGARIVSTGVLTAFKFNASSRRNSYRIRSAWEQEQMLQRLRGEEDIRQAELVAVIEAVAAEQYLRIEAPPVADPGFHAKTVARFKGTSKVPLIWTEIREPMRCRLDDHLTGFEWHYVEVSDQWGTSRWSGPAPVSSLEFPIWAHADVRVRVHVIGHMLDDLSKDVTLLVNDRRVTWDLEPTPEGTTNICAVVPPCGRDRPLCITFQLARMTRPIDLGGSEDRRPLGIAVSWVDFEPLS
jgi:glycosyltransferase involved in cell wall biosynthesis